MKRFLFLVALLVALSGNAFADVATGTFGDQDLANVYGLTAFRDPLNNVYFTYAPDAGIKYPYLESTTNLTLGAFQSGIIFGVYPSQNHSQWTVPTAVPGLDFYFAAGNNGKTWAIEIQPTDVISYPGETTGLGISNSSAAQGDAIELFCVFAGQWIVKDRTGTWTAGN